MHGTGEPKETKDVKDVKDVKKAVHEWRGWSNEQPHIGRTIAPYVGAVCGCEL